MNTATYVAAHRFGMGVDAEDTQRISKNPQTWLKQQIQRPKAAQLTHASLLTTEELSKKVLRHRGAQPQQSKQFLKQGFDIYQQEMQARFHQAVHSKTPLLERLVLFWSNHFTVSAQGKPYIAPLLGAFEREAIRPYVLGRFSDLLKAVIQHPAMLIYLDNVSSFGPNSRIGKRRNRGLNENLARELLELHTLGVNGGYGQNDVMGLANILTGWTLKPKKWGGGGYRFMQQAHEPGAHRLLGKSYPASGEQQGLTALKDLAQHPSTAEFIATKMAQHFIADQPSQQSIETLTTVFKQTDGDLKAMTEALIDMDASWNQAQTKVKRPYEMIVSTFRMLSLPVEKIPFKHIAQSLTLFQQLPFQAPSPAGWSDQAADWLSPQAVMNRVEWCHTLALKVRAREKPLSTAQWALGEVAAPDTLRWIENAPSSTEGLALLLASPEWQKR